MSEHVAICSLLKWPGGKKIAGGLVKSWIITTFAGRLYPKTERIGACGMLLGRASLCVMMQVIN